MMRVFAVSCLLLAWVTQGNAQSLQRIELSDVGIYTVHIDKVDQTPRTATGTSNTISNERLIQVTSTVPARLGVSFGFRYRLIGNSGAEVTLKKVTHIPAPGIRNPSTGSVASTSTIFLHRVVGDSSFATYGFDNSWEIVLGTWTMELWYGDRKLAVQSFNVVKQ